MKFIVKLLNRLMTFSPVVYKRIGVAIWWFNLVDAAFTVSFFNHENFYEANPFVKFLLDIHPLFAYLTKIIFISIFVYWLVKVAVGSNESYANSARMGLVFCLIPYFLIALLYLVIYPIFFIYGVI